MVRAVHPTRTTAVAYCLDQTRLGISLVDQPARDTPSHRNDPNLDPQYSNELSLYGRRIDRSEVIGAHEVDVFGRVTDIEQPDLLEAEFLKVRTRLRRNLDHIDTITSHSSRSRPA